MYPKLEKELARRYPTRTQLIRYLREALDLKEVNWQDMTKFNLSRFAEYIQNIVTPNSATTYFNVLCGLFAPMMDEGIIPCKKPHDVLKSHKEPQQNVALTEDEVSRVWNYYQRIYNGNATQAEKDVLTMFLIECYCGARGCDVEDFTMDNVKDGILSYVSKKTRILSRIPAHKHLATLIQRIPRGKTYYNSVKGRILKRVCKACGIDDEVSIFYHGKYVTRKKYELIAQHSARRSFASCLAAKGVPIIDISHYMGHQDTTMTAKYIKVDTTKVSDAARQFFYG